MSSLTQEQEATVAQWIRDGVGIADVQKQLESEFGIRLTYMDTRFVIDDLNLDLPQPEKPEEVEEEPQDAMPLGGLQLEVDKLTTPGTLVSGSVTFSDGMNAKWYVDQTGRLGLNPDTEGYQPSEEDLQTFQVELKAELQKRQF